MVIRGRAIEAMQSPSLPPGDGFPAPTWASGEKLLCLQSVSEQLHPENAVCSCLRVLWWRIGILQVMPSMWSWSMATDGNRRGDLTTWWLAARPRHRHAVKRPCWHQQLAEKWLETVSQPQCQSNRWWPCLRKQLGSLHMQPNPLAIAGCCSKGMLATSLDHTAQSTYGLPQS